MTQTVTKRDGDLVYIYSKNGEKLNRVKTFVVEPYTISDFFTDIEGEYSDFLNAYLNELKEAFIRSNSSTIWELKNSDGFANMDGVVRYHATKKDAFQEAESQNC